MYALSAAAAARENSMKAARIRAISFFNCILMGDTSFLFQYWIHGDCRLYSMIPEHAQVFLPQLFFSWLFLSSLTIRVVKTTVAGIFIVSRKVLHYDDADE